MKTISSPNSIRLHALLEKSSQQEKFESLRESINNNADILLQVWLDGKLNIRGIHNLFIESGYIVSYSRFSLLFKKLREHHGYIGRRYDLVEQKENYKPAPRAQTKKTQESSTIKQPKPIKEEPIIQDLRSQLLRPNATQLALKQQRDKDEQKTK